MDKYDASERNPISQEFASETFSKAGFKADSAICEIIDNSIEANSQHITIRIDWAEKQHGREWLRVKKIAFIDDGDGMDANGVYDYFIATESTKRNRDSGIGKFGVGAYMSCISQARTGIVYSKTKDGKWVSTIMKKGRKIPKPISKEPPEEYLMHEHGTVIIWDDIYNDIKETEIFNKAGNRDDDQPVLLDELGRIYRKFIADHKIIPNKTVGKTEKIKNNRKVSIKIETEHDSQAVEPYDPLFVTYNRNKSDTEKPKMQSHMVRLSTGSHTGYMYITVSYFPNSWWDDKYRPGIHTENKKRGITARNEGISLVREGRELYFGPYPGGPIKILNAHNTPGKRAHFETVDRWTGIEIEFSRNEDDIFGVEFNKTRIRMEPYARMMISKEISETVVQRRNDFTSARREVGDKKKKSKRRSEKIQTGMKKPQFDEKAKKELWEFAERNKANPETTQEVFDDLMKGFHISEDNNLDETSPFVTFRSALGALLVKYNTRHPFTSRMIHLFTEIDEACSSQKPDVKAIHDIVADLHGWIDILVAGYGYSEKQFTNTYEDKKIEDTLEDIRTEWNKIVRRLSSEKPE